ncbi:hypothetical protein [Lutimonas sp.]|uniref:hypothetical protein n=1 Tax=Lutimonas sp. TaxID=1872403 RepID=UPI003D9AFDAE
MKLYKTPILILFISFLFISCGKEKKEDKTTPEVAESAHQWTEKNMLEFERNCVGFLESEDVKNAKIYCDCLLKSSIEAYPDAQVAMELEQNQIVELFVNSKCIDDLLLIKIEDPWTEDVEKLFLDHCKKAQKEKGATDEKANSYCDCALGEIKEIVPNPQHVMALTEEELAHILEKCK